MKQRYTKTQKLYAVLSDGRWHSTKELVRRVGHTFGGAKYKLDRAGYPIEKRPHLTKLYQWQYRLPEHPEPFAKGVRE